MIEFDDFETEVKTAEIEVKPKPIKETKFPLNDSGLMPLGLHDGISNADYHKGKGISSSSLKDVLRCPAYYDARKKGIVKQEESDAMNLGTAVHKLVLEPDDFESEIVVSPNFSGKGSVAAKAEFKSENKGKTIITADQMVKCNGMRDSIMSLPESLAIFNKGKAEQSGYYIDKETGMLCKYRPDWRTDWSLFDIKTTRDASPQKFARTIVDLGYHISAAHYLAGDKETSKTDHEQFIFICVEPEPPYLAVPYVLSEKSLELGYFKRRQALDLIKFCRDNDEWPTYNAGVCQQIDVPNYALYELESSKI